MQDLDCDFYAISCHKMYGPTGLGVLYAKKKWLEELPPYQGGGGMIGEVKKEGITFGDLPNKYEAGTMATAQVIAFGESINFINKLGIEKIEEHEKLCRIMQKQTHDKIHKLENQINRIESILLVSTGALITGMGYVIFTLILQ